MKWIKHDTDANQDNKLQNVLLDYGLEGYGLYWYCLELIGSKVDKDNITFELEHDARVIARNTGCTPQKVEEMMRYFVSQKLFEQSDNVVTCLAMAKRLDKSMTSSPQMRDIIGNLSLNNTVKEGYVYFIENSDRNGDVVEIKVGRSANPHARLVEHKKKYAEFGFNLNLIKTIKSDDCVSLETEIHRKLNDFKVRDEWFEACESVYEILRHDYGLTTSCKIRLDKIRLEENKSIDQSKIDRDNFINEAFEYWWARWPKKVAKKNTLKAWQKTVKKKSDQEVRDLTNHIVDDVALRMADIEAGGKKYIGFDMLHATTYLNQERYNDDI